MRSRSRGKSSALHPRRMLNLCIVSAPAAENTIPVPRPAGLHKPADGPGAPLPAPPPRELPGREPGPLPGCSPAPGPAGSVRMLGSLCDLPRGRKQPVPSSDAAMRWRAGSSEAGGGGGAHGAGGGRGTMGTGVRRRRRRRRGVSRARPAAAASSPAPWAGCGGALRRHRALSGQLRAPQGGWAMLPGGVGKSRGADRRPGPPPPPPGTSPPGTHPRASLPESPQAAAVLSASVGKHWDSPMVPRERPCDVTAGGGRGRVEGGGGGGRTGAAPALHKGGGRRRCARLRGSAPTGST